MARETQISRDDSYPLLLCRRSCARSPWAFSFKKLRWCGGVDDLRDEGRLIMSRVPSVRVSCVCVCVKQGRPGKPTIGRCFKSSRQEQYGELGHLAAKNERIHTSFMNHEQYREENLQARFFSLQKGDVIVCYQS